MRTERGGHLRPVGTGQGAPRTVPSIWWIPPTRSSSSVSRGGHRPGVMETLSDVAAEGTQRVHVLLALGDHGEPQVVAEIDRGA